ncbi:16S rRNA (cytidine(1402)-2'-O)-methyltransferase [Fulvivirgaceae bacterium PWU4]|uniref:Ribosomal RNA small subunit methyltransferase I n=1 Tax=Chryseosolibacter histidini TaxID=2782349 RepID=A0AAP2DM72_9BACT|nr:16S rRNA (cytidine(1402)-2'-O)-methyltransferase [Chryseosolibacter histidini]MBT1698928.1 16S rRNA (cytidine(1402)-2'-O)-methyltransferase [Chryseosolibacter histidini]
MDKERRTSLYLVPTPIGNLADITLRALDTLKSVDVILAEDTRTSGFLLKHYAISKPLQSFHNFNEHKILDGLIERMEKGEVMALVSDAGTPGISDPGFLLARACVEANLTIECLPGPTAFVPALVKSGLPSDRFVFEGFLPHKKGRQTMLRKLAEEERTMIFYESPYRLVKTLEQFIEYFGADRKGSVSRELTKMFEETVNGTLSEIVNHFKIKEVKGEIVIVIHGKTED